MVDIMDRRVTRSLSNELGARQAQQSASHSHAVPSGYHARSCHSHQPRNSVEQGQQLHPQQQQQQDSQQQQQQSIAGMDGGMGSSGGGPVVCPRTTSEEIFLNTWMNTPLSPLTPTIPRAQQQAMMSQTVRGNSEELFTSWLTATPENANQYQTSMYSGPSSNGNRPPQNSQRMSSELQAIVAQKNGTPLAPQVDNMEKAYMQTSSSLSNDIMSNINRDLKPYRTNPSEDKSGPIDYNDAGSLKNMWFNATSPMTRSRSSELRRRYAEMEGLPTPPPVDIFQKLATQRTLEGVVNPTMTSMGTFTQEVGLIGSNGGHSNNPNSKRMGSQAPLIPPIVSRTPVNQKQQIQQPPPPTINALTHVVGLLKGSLERKKLQTKQQQQMSPQHMSQQRQMPQQQLEPQHEVRSRSIMEPQQGLSARPTPMSSPQVSVGQDESLGKPKDQRQHFHAQSGQVQQNSGMELVHSPDESSWGAPTPSYSAGIATSDGPSNSAMSAQTQSLKRGNGSGAVDQPSPKLKMFNGIDNGPNCHGEYLENGTTKLDLLKNLDQLARASSITSSLRTGFLLNELDGATRKRRVERQRKMAEAKGRGNAPPMPADMQTTIRRCEALEKEVRSLKLNLSFMNRKDSEQTTKIEELEQQNEGLKEQRDKLLKELDLVSTSHNPQ